VVRKRTDDTHAFKDEMHRLRLRIDEYDTKIIEVLGKRMRIADEIGALKKENNVAVLQSRRWKEILEKMQYEGKAENLGEEFIQKLFRAIHQESINHQEKIINKH
jgi:chorismate mutase